MGIKNSIIRKVTDRARKTAEALLQKTGVTTGFSQQNLKLICKMYNSTLLTFGSQYTVQTRAKLIPNIQDDIRTLLTQGKTKEEVMAFYWEVQEFQVLWTNLNLTQRDFENIVDFEVSNKDRENP